MSVERLVNIILRGTTLASKFLLIFFLARFLEPEEVGLYGLLVAALSYSTYLLGLDFYTYVTREIIAHSRDDWGRVMKSQAALSLGLYALFIPLIMLVFVGEVLPWVLVSWFLILLVLGHINQEFMRILIAISKPLTASVALFLRTGVWVLLVIPLMCFVPNMRKLEAVLLAWTLGEFIAFILVALIWSRMGIGGWRKSIDWVWIGKGVRVALPLLMASLAIRGIYTFDRYWLEAIAGLEVVGAYVLFIGVATAMISFLDAGVFAFSYPVLIRAFQKGDAPKYCRELKKLLLHTALLSLFFAASALLLIKYLLAWLNKPIYTLHQDMFTWIIMATVLSALSMVPHYGLYAQSRDRPIIISHIVGLIIFILATLFFIQYWPGIAIPLALCAAFFVIAIWKFIAFFRLTPARYYKANS